MKCPLFMTGHTTVLGREPLAQGDCIRTDCSWWDPDHGVCAVRTLATELTIATLKMPHEGQFRQ